MRRVAGTHRVRNLGLMLAVLVAGLAATEGCLAWVGAYPPDPDLYPGDRIAAQGGVQADSFIGWKMPPDTALRGGRPERPVTYLADSTGFRRGPEVDRIGSRNRLVFLGDSYTFGEGLEYEQTFPARLEGDLQETRSYNFGMPGFGLDQMWRMFHHYGRRVAPTLVILTFINTDLRRSLTAYRMRTSDDPGARPQWWRKPTYRLAGDSLVPLTEADRPNALVRFILGHSRLVELWDRASWRLSLQLAVGARWRLNEAIFRAIRDECRNAGARLVVVRIPEPGQWRPATAIGRAVARQGIEFLDLVTLLPPSPNDLYFEDDPHLNARGNQWVAQALGDFLVARGLAPQR